MRKELSDIEYVIRDALLTAQSTTKNPIPTIIFMSEKPFKYIGDMDHSIKVLSWFWTDRLSIDDKRIIALRLGRVKMMSFKQISKPLHSNRETIRRQYYSALEIMKDYVIKSGGWDEKRIEKIILFAKNSGFF